MTRETNEIKAKYFRNHPTGSWENAKQHKGGTVYVWSARFKYILIRILFAL